MREAVRRVASNASNGSENNFNDWDRNQERPARRILARSRSEAGASLGESCDFNESHRKFSESFNDGSFRQNSADFDAEGGWVSRGGGVGSFPNRQPGGSGSQKEGRGGRVGGLGAGLELMPAVPVDGATDVCWSRLEHHHPPSSHLTNEQEFNGQPSDLVSNNSQIL